MKMHHQYATEIHPDTDKEKTFTFVGTHGTFSNSV